MCFTQEQSLYIGTAELIIGSLICIFYSHKASGSLIWFYFSFMEYIQYFQYYYIASSPNDPICTSTKLNMNKILTYIGFLHICFQPFISHLTNYYLTTNFIFKNRIKGFVILTFIGGLMDFSHCFIHIGSPFSSNKYLEPNWDNCRGDSWLVGNYACTYKGNTHLGWIIPFGRMNYYRPVTLHSFLFFIPFFCTGNIDDVFTGIILIIFGPIMSEYITNGSPYESASVWCLWNIIQLMLISLKALLKKRKSINKIHPYQNITNNNNKKVKST